MSHSGPFCGPPCCRLWARPFVSLAGSTDTNLFPWLTSRVFYRGARFRHNSLAHIAWCMTGFCVENDANSRYHVDFSEYPADPLVHTPHSPSGRTRAALGETNQRFCSRRNELKSKKSPSEGGSAHRCSMGAQWARNGEFALTAPARARIFRRSI